jgi:hypothetical protein
MTPEELAGLARVLGFREIAFVSKRVAPTHQYLIDRDGTLEGETQWNGADLTCALLARLVELGYEPDIRCRWNEWKVETGLSRGSSPDIHTAVINAALRLPEAKGE